MCNKPIILDLSLTSKEFRDYIKHPNKNSKASKVMKVWHQIITNAEK